MGYWLRDRIAFCVACGAPFTKDPTSWLSKATIIHCPQTDSPDGIPEDVFEICPLQSTGGAFFRSPNGGPEYSTGDDSPTAYPGSYPLHPECLEIAKRVLSYNSSLGTKGPNSLREMIEIYWERLEDTIANENTNGPLNYLGEPNEYYGYGGNIHRYCLDVDLGEEAKKYLREPISVGKRDWLHFHPSAALNHSRLSRISGPQSPTRKPAKGTPLPHNPAPPAHRRPSSGMHAYPPTIRMARCSTLSKSPPMALGSQTMPNTTAV